MAGSTNWWDAFDTGQDDYAGPTAGNLLPSHTSFPGSAPLPKGLPSYASSGADILKLLRGAGGQSQSQGQPGSGMADLASTLGAFSSGQKANRALEGQLTQGYDRIALEDQVGRNQNEQDAMKKLHQTSYVLGGGSQFKPPTLSLGGKTYNSPDLGFGPPKISDAERAGASALQGQLQSRLSPGGSVSPTPLDNYAKPGLSENLSSYGGAALGGLGALNSMSGGKVGSAIGAGLKGAGSKLAGLFGGGGAAAGAGAGVGIGETGATLGLAGSGFGGAAAGGAAATGGGLGSTLGALATNPWTIGIAGALGGGYLLKKLIDKSNPSKEELAGRDIEGNFERGLGGFNPMMGAVGQAYQKAGLSSAQAQADVKAMLDAEKQGPGATMAALQKIQSVMGRG